MNQSDKKSAELRRGFKYLLLQNLNYFGSFTETDIEGMPEPVQKIVSDTSFEELTCLGYNPDTDVLTAIVEVKKGSGYSGGPCTDGSDEHIRFYLDYGDGNWIDHGVASFDAHDLGFRQKLCYAVSIRLNPKRRSCCDKKPVLPRVRGILSWNNVPPANTPNWLPVWGNRLEQNIQIDPLNHIFCTLLPDLEVGVSKIDPVLLAKIKEIIDSAGPAPKPDANLTELAKKSSDKKLGQLRTVFPLLTKMTGGSTDLAAFEALKPLKIDLSKFDDFILKPNFNTSYEELHCVGLDRDRDLLHGVVQIKRDTGYSGDLCTNGSWEYIAFYLDFGAGWEYQGTTAVNVHDIDVPKGGLWYQAALPVQLDEHRQQWCETGRARIRGILSWAAPPPPNDPDHVPHWGDREDCWIEIRPLPIGVYPGVFTPVLESIGNISVGKINGAGYANGTAVGGIYAADDSPFGGRITLKGNAFNLPGGPLEYRIMLQGPSDPFPHAFTEQFEADVTTFPSITPVSTPVNAVGDWFPYLAASPFVSVAEGLLGVLKGLSNGLHTVYLEFRQPAGPVLGSTPPRLFMVDNTAPIVDVEITSGAGNCGKFGVGEVIAGTFSMTEIHSGHLRLSVTPLPEAAGGTMAILSAVPAGAAFAPPVSGANATATLTYGGLTLSTTGVAAGTWELDTTGMEPCGYNIRIRGEDRTIVNSGHIGWEDWDIEGFCLE